MHELVEPIFPTPFLRVNLKDKITKNVEAEILSLKNYSLDLEKNFSRNTSGNWISNNFQILDNLELKQIFQPYIDFFAFDIRGEAASQAISGSWLNVNPPNFGHHKHRHANSKISGVFYIRTNEKSGNFNIYRYLERGEEVCDDLSNFNDFNYEFLWYRPKEYDLFLFNSVMFHSVDPNQSEESRLSLAFNTFYSSPIGKSAHSLPIKANYFK